MKSTWPLLFIIFCTSTEAQVIIHKKTEYFLDIELSKKQFLIDCSGVPKDDNVIVGFNLLSEDTYYLFFYRGTRSKKRCIELKKEYTEMLRDHETVRIVGNHPNESVIVDPKRKGFPVPYNKAKKIVSSFFIRLQAGNKCKAYFSEHCDLPKNYWGGVTPEKE